MTGLPCRKIVRSFCYAKIQGDLNKMSWWYLAVIWTRSVLLLEISVLKEKSHQVSSLLSILKSRFSLDLFLGLLRSAKIRLGWERHERLLFLHEGKHIYLRLSSHPRVWTHRVKWSYYGTGSSSCSNPFTDKTWYIPTKVLLSGSSDRAK